MSNRKMNVKNNKAKTKVYNAIPPQINIKNSYFTVLRFKAASVVTGIIITRRCMLSLYSSCSAVTQQDMVTAFSGIKLKKVEVWAPSLTVEAMGTATVEWQDPRAPSISVSDTGNTTRLAHVITKPPKGSLASQWSSYNATYINEALFIITCTANSIIDLHVNFVLSNGSSVTDPNIEYMVRNVTTGVVGNFRAALDNSSFAGGAGGFVMAPVGVVSPANFIN